MANPNQPLLTPTSLALSLSPPRCPPPGNWVNDLYYSCVHDLARKKNHEIKTLLSKTSASNAGDSEELNKSHELLSRLLTEIIHREESDGKQCQCCKSNPFHQKPQRMTRYIGSILPLHWQHDFRDSGKFRSVADGLVRLTVPLVAAGSWRDIRDLLLKWKREKIRYGEHEMQHIDLFWPNDDIDGLNCIKGVLFFVHGGAWGSGHPWMYHLVAPSFLQRGFVVAIVGYRTYPCVKVVTPDLDGAGGASGDSQLCDIKSAWDALQKVMGSVTSDNKHHEGWVGNVLMGHSSGAHIALLMLVEMIGERLKNNNSETAAKIYPDYFVGLSGPYDISNHFDFEAGRGVEQISPMKAICGGSRDNFSIASPVSRMLNITSISAKPHTLTIQECSPPMLFVHGIEDTTVPFTASADAARSLRSCGLINCDEVYLDKCGHQDVVMHFMLNGAAKDVVMDCLISSKQFLGLHGDQRVEIKSRL